MEDALELTKADAMWLALINAVKEQQAIIEDLKASNEQLQTKVDDVDALKAEIENIKSILGASAHR